jgi:hypothetical protein
VAEVLPWTVAYIDVQERHFHLPIHTKNVFIRPEMDDQGTVTALLLPADGSPIKVVNCSIKERDDEDMVDSGMAEFFDPIPNLKPWFGDEYQHRAMAAFHVATKESNYADPIARAFVRFDNIAVHGQYCLYYTLSPNLAANETCKRPLGYPPSDRYFWRGNVLAVRYDGHLDMGHRFKSVEVAAIEPIKEVLRRIHESKGLERVHKEYESFSLKADRKVCYRVAQLRFKLVDTV